jgi:hypothetical protein
MKKKEYIEKYGTEAYKKMLKQNAAWQTANPEKVKANNAEASRKGGKRYVKRRLYSTTGIQGEKQTTRYSHGRIYRPIKRIIDPRGLSNLHHRWRTNSSEYTAVGIVEAKGHRKGIINVFSTEDCPYEDVIQLLAGKIALAKEKDIPKFEARMNTTEKRIKMDAIVAEIVKQRLLSEPTLEEWKVRYEVREEVYKNNI